VVGRYDPDTRRHRMLDLLKPGLDTLDDLQGVLNKTHDDDSANRLPLAVQFGDASPDVWSNPHLRDVTDTDGSASGTRSERHAFDIGQRGEVAPPANHVLAA